MSEHVNEDSQEVATQQQTQSTQQTSQPDPNVDAHLWGYLLPCSGSLTRIDFWKVHPRYTIGRNVQSNQVVLPGFKVSNTHCTITWDGKEDRDSSVLVHDLSSNGTYINGVKIGKAQTRILREGNEIAFGTSVPQPQSNGIEDYRFVYRHCAGGPPTEGLWAHYDIGVELGKGSFATVMKAVSRKDGKWYAVKMIANRGNRDGNDSASSSKTTAFAREISIMEKLKHPNICELKEVFYEPRGDIHLVLELIEGGDLLDYIIRQSGLPEVKARHITYQICQALAYIHAQGVAHRDLKPENVLLTREEPPTVKVADFGLAKVVDSLTMLRTMCGTPSYLAPEVVKQLNNEGYDNLVDSWSVGVIVFSMLTNSSPFIEDDSIRDIRTRIAERTIDWTVLNEAGSSPSDECCDFVRRLLDEDPTTRMTLTDACNHPWLQAYDKDDPLDEHPEKVIAAAHRKLAVDRSMLSPDREDDDLSLLDNSLPSLQREASRAAPLQRRSHVVSKAVEDNGGELPQDWNVGAPSNTQEGNRRTNPTTRKGTSKGHNKRMHSELTPLPEDEDADMRDGSSSPVRKNPIRKRGKSGEGEPQVSPTPARTTRARSRAPVPNGVPSSTGRKAAAASGALAEEQPRRSNRQRRA